MTHKRALKFLTDLNSLGHFPFSNKQPLKAKARFLEKSKYYTYLIMFRKKNSGVSGVNPGSP